MKKEYQKLVKVAAAVLVLAAAGFSYCFCGRTDGTVRLAETELEADGAAYETAAMETAAAEPTETDAPYYVYVCGEVAAPGVYTLEAGSRIAAAIEAAGGFTDEAAEEALNLAAPVTDGMQITVYSEEDFSRLPVSIGAESGSGDTRINLNTATKEELMTLTGIGESKAEKILQYREENGGFQTIEDIMNISGIKEAGFQKIKDRIMV